MNHIIVTPCGYNVAHDANGQYQECSGSMNVRECLCNRCPIHRLSGEVKDAKGTQNNVASIVCPHDSFRLFHVCCGNCERRKRGGVERGCIEVKVMSHPAKHKATATF